jgi:hypothetical protein
MCNCAESKLHGVSNNLRRHDCQYVALRNSFIPAAEAFANKRAPRGDWTRVFIRKMDDLVRDDQRKDHNKDTDTEPADLLQVLLRASGILSSPWLFNRQ